MKLRCDWLAGLHVNEYVIVICDWLVGLQINEVRLRVNELRLRVRQMRYDPPGLQLNTILQGV